MTPADRENPQPPQFITDRNTFTGPAGDIFVIKAGEIHSFKAVGDSPLVQLDIHLSPRFIQEDL
jgi:quercetin dioxygenase-like cupin family protein